MMMMMMIIITAPKLHTINSVLGTKLIVSFGAV